MMSQMIIASTTGELEKVAELIRDQWLSIDDRATSSANELVLPMAIEDEPRQTTGLWANRTILQSRRATLRIGNLVEHEVEDPECIGATPVSEISLDGDTVTIQGCAPVALRAKVSGLLVTLEVTDEIVDKTVSCRIFGFDIFDQSPSFHTRKGVFKWQRRP